MEVLVSCGSKLRHTYFALKIATEFSDTNIFVELYEEDTIKNYTEIESDILGKCFDEFDKTEKCFFQNM